MRFHRCCGNIVFPEWKQSQHHSRALCVSCCHFSQEQRTFLWAAFTRILSTLRVARAIARLYRNYFDAPRSSALTCRGEMELGAIFQHVRISKLEKFNGTWEVLQFIWNCFHRTLSGIFSVFFFQINFFYYYFPLAFPRHFPKKRSSYDFWSITQNVHLSYYWICQNPK